MNKILAISVIVLFAVVMGFSAIASTAPDAAATDKAKVPSKVCEDLRDKIPPAVWEKICGAYR